MFASIAELLSPGAALVLIISKDEAGDLNVNITPKGDLKNKALNAGLNLVASPEELDREFATVMAQYATARASLVEQVEAAATVLGKEGAAVATATAKELAAPAKTKTRPTATATDECTQEHDEAGERDDAPAARPTPAAAGKPAAEQQAPSSVNLF